MVHRRSTESRSLSREIPRCLKAFRPNLSGRLSVELRAFRLMRVLAPGAAVLQTQSVRLVPPWPIKGTLVSESTSFLTPRVPLRPFQPPPPPMLDNPRDRERFEVV